MDLPDFLIDHPDGEIRVRDTRLGLYHLIRRYLEGWTAERLHDEYASLSLPLARDLIAFYHRQQTEVDAYVAAYEAELDRQRAAAPPPKFTIEELRRRLRERRSQGHGA